MLVAPVKRPFLPFLLCFLQLVLCTDRFVLLPIALQLTSAHPPTCPTYIVCPTPRIALSVGWLGGWLVTKFQPHHTHMQHSQGLNITDVCIIIKEHMYMHRAYMIKEHMYMHNTYMHNVYMHQSRGLYMHDKYAAS